MHPIEKKLKKAEAKYKSEKTGKNALALFACYILAGKTTDKEGAYLSKAFHTAVTAHHDDLLDLDIISAVLYSHVLLENFESAYELVSALEAHSSFLSKNMPLYYGVTLYFNALMQHGEEKARGAKKLYKNLELLYEKTGLIPLAALLGSLQKVVFGDIRQCAKMYAEALTKQCASVFLYIEMYELLMTAEEYSKDLNEISRAVIPWALNKDLPIGLILEHIEKRTLISILFSLSTKHLSKIFKRYELWSAFQCLCQKLIYSSDTSEEALSYYKIALANNLSLRGLFHISVVSAHKNSRYDLPLFVVEAALSQPTNYSAEQISFLMAQHISRCENPESIAEQRENIVRFGLWAHSKGLKGRDYNVIFKYLHDLYPEDGRFLETLSVELFKYEIVFNAESPKYVCVYEHTKKGMSRYEVVNGKCCISSPGGFELYFLGDGKNEYMCVSDYTVTKLLASGGTALAEALYEKGFETADIIIALALKYMNASALDKRKLDILQKATGITEISKNLRIDICGALAYHYANERQFSLAIHYYTYLGENNIKPHCLPGALNTYIATGRYDKALSLITKKHYALTETAVFNALNVMYEKADSVEAASVCYNLILNDLCSTEILNIVIRRFKGTTAEWLKLTNKIDSLGFDVSQLYERIIINGIFIGSISADCNEAFVKLYQKNKDHPIIQKYAYFCCYEIIRNEKIITDELSDVLEELYYATGENKLLCYALAITYMKSGRFDKPRIVGEAAAYLDEDGIILQPFKDYQYKSFLCSYIEKNTPFTCYRPPGKTIYLCYKTDDMKDYEKKALKYFKFGIYSVNLSIFYGETVSYYFEEENGAKTEEQTFVNNHMRIVEQFKDPYYTVNNILIYEHMMKFDEAEALMEQEVTRSESFSVLTL